MVISVERQENVAKLFFCLFDSASHGMNNGPEIVESFVGDGDFVQELRKSYVLSVREEQSAGIDASKLDATSESRVS